VRNANDPRENDVLPTIWRGRIAWTRQYSTGAVVYTKALRAPRSQPSTRLPGVPERRCLSSGRCVPTGDRDVTALELVGDRLALTATYTCRACSGIAQTDVRLDDVRTREVVLVARMTVGLNGQQFVGPSLPRGRVGWYLACAVPEASCRSLAGPFRFRLSDGRYERASGPIRVSGYADTGPRLYETIDCGDPVGAAISPPGESCRIEGLAAPAFRSTSTPIR
jgi:hypothetical protein